MNGWVILYRGRPTSWPRVYGLFHSREEAEEEARTLFNGSSVSWYVTVVSD